MLHSPMMHEPGLEGSQGTRQTQMLNASRQASLMLVQSASDAHGSQQRPLKQTCVEGHIVPTSSQMIPTSPLSGRPLSGGMPASVSGTPESGSGTPLSSGTTPLSSSTGMPASF